MNVQRRGQRRAAGGGMPGRPASHYRLRLPEASRGAPVLSPQQRAVVDHESGRLAVLAGPGTGKTTTIVEAVADRILRRGLPPESILVLTFSRAAANELSQRIMARLSVTTREPMVRTLHSYAYALVRAAAAAAGEPAPALLPAGQADLMVREMLAGHAEQGGSYWPPELHSALRVSTFAAELREFMLRVAEHRVSPRQLDHWGVRRRRPQWRAVARFIQEYRDITGLRQGTTRRGAVLDQAELTVAAVQCLEDPVLLSRQHQLVRRIFVDEYQDVDPAQIALIDLLSQGADELVAVGDPDQAIYSFRGATSGALESLPVDRTVSLTVSRRLPPPLVVASRRVADLLPGPRAHRALAAAEHLTSPSGAAQTAVECRTGSGPRGATTTDGMTGNGEVLAEECGFLDVRLLRSSTQEAAYVADQLRRAHLQEGVPWGEMAVLVRSPAESAEGLRRALDAVGVPVRDTMSGPLAQEPLVAALLKVLRAGMGLPMVSSADALALLSSPLCRLDALAVRRLRRSVRAAAGGAASSGDLLAAMVSGAATIPASVPEELSAEVRHVAALLSVVAGRIAEPSAESVLWEVWESSGLAQELLAASELGGADGRWADRQLDAVVELFDRAAQLAVDVPFAGVQGLIDLVDDEQFASPRRSMGDEIGGTDAVVITSAHASKGREWDVVAIARVQEDLWPDLRTRRSLLGQEELLDVLAGIEEDLPTRSGLAEERRLFYVAATRARRRLIVTAVSSTTEAPSRFIADLLGGAAPAEGWPAAAHGRERRALNLPALVAELRRTACQMDAPDQVDRASAARSVVPAQDRAPRAAGVLAVLADEGVVGAAPAQWYGLREVTTNSPITSPGMPVVLSPSQVESLSECTLRTVLERRGGRSEPGQAQLLGIAVHALAQGIAMGATSVELDHAVDAVVASHDELAPWERARMRRRMESMRTALEAWVGSAMSARTFLGSEVPVDVSIPEQHLPGDGEQHLSGDEAIIEGPQPDSTPPEVRLRGRIDWLSTDADGRVVITDFKTGSTKPTVAATQSHPQLASYQVALALGALHDLTGGQLPDVAGAELVYVASGRPELRIQPPLSAQDRGLWAHRLRELGLESTGPTLTAREGEYCQRCPVRSSCPLQPEGKQVGQ